VTYGTLLDEIVRRATGASIASHVRTSIAEPLGIDMWIGVPENVIQRVVPGRWEEHSPVEPADEDLQPGSYAAARQEFLRENPPMDDPDASNPEEVRAHYTANAPPSERLPMLAPWPPCTPRCSDP
jgi:CubicO group peptidase (beta-lactamase class C family)